MRALSCFRGFCTAYSLSLLSLLLSRFTSLLSFLLLALSFLLLVPAPLLSPLTFLALVELDKKTPCLVKRLEGLDHLHRRSSDAACYEHRAGHR